MLIRKPQDLLLLLAPIDATVELDRLFVKAPDSKVKPMGFFGEFELKPDVHLQTLAEHYGVTLTDDISHLTIDELFQKRFYNRPVVGDRVQLGELQLVIKNIDGQKVMSVGLKIKRE